jgi:SAM-dependent methyltransferase
MGAGAGTEHLASLVPRGFAGSALDLGCGAGTLALVAASRGARRAVGVDINARAIALAQANARLNGLRAEFLTGDGVEPVRAERFDLVLAQPPFVVRPAGGPAITYLHGGAGGDELAERFVRAIPGVLAPGGRALMLLQTPARPGEPLPARLRGLVGGAPVDILALSTEAPSPALQAAVFASFEDPTLGAPYGAAVARYLDHFAGLGITEMRGALVLLARAAADAPGKRFTAGLRLSHAEYDAGTLAGYAAGLALGGQPEPSLAAARLRLSPHLRLRVEQSHLREDGGAAALLHIDAPGIGADWDVSAGERQILAAIDGADSVGAAIAAVAEARGRDAGAVRGEVLAIARAALTHGALLRDPPPG